MNMMDGRTISLTYLPPELIELIGEYLTPADIRALRSVNRYCHSVFNNENYWKTFLTYPEKYYLCDLKSQSKTPGIAEVVEEITEGRMSKWLGYLKLQNIHLKNWYSEQTEITDRFLGPSSFCDSWDIVDDFNEHWLFLQDFNDMIFVWNITAKPRALEPLSLRTIEKDECSRMTLECSGMTLSPQGKVLFELYNEDKNATYFKVYRFSKCALKLKFEHGIEDSYLNSEISFRVKKVVVCDKYLIVCLRPSKQYGDCFIKMWDWHVGHELAAPDLSKEELWQDFKTRNNIKSESVLRIEPYEGSSPNIIIVLGYGDLQLVNIFNLERRELTHVVDTVTKVISCQMKWNSICLCCTRKKRFNLFLYSFTSSKVELLYKCNYAFIPHFRITKTKIIFTSGCGSVSVMDTSPGKKVIKICDLSEPIQGIRTFIEPNLLVVHTILGLKVLHLSFKDKLSIIHEYFLPHTALWVAVFPTYPSKLIARDYMENALCVYTF